MIQLPFKQRVFAALAASFLLAGCSLTGKQSAPSASLAPPVSKALAFSADESLTQKLSPKAQTALAAAERQALDYGQPGQSVTWSTVADRSSGVVIAYQPFRVGGSNCRKFRHDIKAKSGLVTADGTACRIADNSWSLVK